MPRTYHKKETAERYDSARRLPEETRVLWMAEVRQLVPPSSVSRILDLGGGTGRFSVPLQQAYECPVVVIDPAKEMFKQGLKHKDYDISWVCGGAEHIPLVGESVDFVWMCQVFHHLENKEQAFREIHRVIRPASYFAIRNGTRENDLEMEWAHCFPEAQQIELERTPSRQQVVNAVPAGLFSYLGMKTVYQCTASSHDEYFDKISQRGLSSHISISDEAFNAGILRLKEWTSRKAKDEPVFEPIDLFVFRKK